MGRISTKENKTLFQEIRDGMELSREEASELLDTISADRLEKIENERLKPRPEEVLIMAEKYQAPELCNYFCSKVCEIGQQYVPEVKMKELPQIILETVASLNTMHRKQERLIEIAADGVISDDELDDFIYIQDELEKISVMVETLQLWSERMLASGLINNEEYEKRRNK